VTELFVHAFFLGLLFNAMPGAILMESLRRGLRGGFRPALDVQVGSLLGDFVWAVLGLLGVAALLALPVFQTPLALAGAALLGWIAWQALRDGLSPMPIFDPSAPAVRPDRSALTTGATLSLANPMNMTYWAGLGGSIAALGVEDPDGAAFAVFLTGFMASSVLWCVVCAGLIVWSRRFIGPGMWMGLHIGCALGLAYFAALVLWRSIN